MSSSVEGICTEGNSSSTSTMVGFLDHFHSSYSCKPCSRGKSGERAAASASSELGTSTNIPRGLWGSWGGWRWRKAGGALL